ncbi:hypothetical protein VTI74DRAFT_2120 [Chaetomium olivicolor]
MSLIHIVLFRFKADAKPEDVKAACGRFLGLKDSGVHPITKAPFIISLKAGADNSLEGLQNGMTHGFVVEFGSAEDRDYYVTKDPTHQEFVKSIGHVLESPSSSTSATVFIRWSRSSSERTDKYLEGRSYLRSGVTC